MEFTIYLMLTAAVIIISWAIMALAFGGAMVALKVPGFNVLKAIKLIMIFVLVNMAVKALAVVTALPDLPTFPTTFATGLIIIGINIHIIKKFAGASYRQAAAAMVVGGIVSFSCSSIIQITVTQAFRCPAGGMMPAMVPGDHFMVSKYAYNNNAPEFGDIVVYRHSENPALEYVRRIIGLPGETIEVRDRVILINNEPVADEWGFFDDSGPVSPKRNFGPFEIPEGEYFVLGDNRYRCPDSRYYGPITHEALVGKAMVRYWPLNRISALHKTHQ